MEKSQNVGIKRAFTPKLNPILNIYRDVMIEMEWEQEGEQDREGKEIPNVELLSWLKVEALLHVMRILGFNYDPKIRHP